MTKETTNYNDHIRGSQLISENDIVSGTISTTSDKRDYYLIMTSTSGKETITLEPNSNLDVDLYVYNSALEELGSSKNAKGKTDEITFDVKSGGSYFIKINRFSGIGDYKLKCQLDTEELEEVSEELKLMIQTVYGEAAACSVAAWKAVSNVIMNRVGKREWKRHKTVTAVIKNSGFDAYTNPNQPYKTAKEYLTNRDGTNQILEQVIESVSDVYNGVISDNTNGCQLYYSPKAQEALHNKYPNIYPEKPNWNFSVLEEVIVSGAEKDDFKFYKYK
jgi:hypothetical protein